ncbi:MAG TPA: hypothetical protein VJ696_12015 [Rhodanobacteraceae bacterium]|nr:hypothetical protein [Rhodanobacteraceae bacterium]
MRKLVFIVGSSVAMCASLAASASTPAFDGVVGTSIGTDLVVDPGFGDQGFTVVSYNDAAGTWDESVRVRAADDGGFWLIGFHRPDTGDDRVAISRLDADGRIDASFGAGGRIAVATGLTWVRDAVVADGRFYIAGVHLLTSSGPSVMAVACLTTQGGYCAGFGDAEGTVTIAANAPGMSSEALRILHRDGTLYVVGTTDPGGGDFGHSSAIAVAKLDAGSGALDGTFGGGSGPLAGTAVFDPDLFPAGMDYAYAAAFAASGDVLVGGSAQTDETQGSDGYVLAFDADTGALDASFGVDGYAYFSLHAGVHYDQTIVRALKVRDDGRIIVAGDANHDDEFFNVVTDVLLASLESNGAPAMSFGVDGVTHVNVGQNTTTTDMAVRPNGDIVVSTPSNGLLPDPYAADVRQSVVQFDAAGNGPTATVSFEYPSEVLPQGWPMSLLVDARDRILVAGFRLWNFDFPIPDSDHSIARLERDTIFAGAFDP